jgi:hypothetical protein
MWLQAALQIHQRLAFRSAVEAQRLFSELATIRESRSEGAMALHVLLSTLCEEPVVKSALETHPRRQLHRAAVILSGGPAEQRIPLEPVAVIV